MAYFSTAAYSAGNVVILEPFIAGAIRARDHDPVQHSGEHRPFDRELELPLGQQFLERRSDPALLPQPAERTAPTMPPAGPESIASLP